MRVTTNLKKIAPDTYEIRRDKWLRMIRISQDPRVYPTYVIQVRSWFRWRDVVFGPYGPNRVGIWRFKIKTIIDGHYQDCLINGKDYTKQGV